MLRVLSVFLFTVFAAFSLAACSKSQRHPALQAELKKTSSSVTSATSAAALGRSTTAVTTEVTVAKNTLLGRPFLYGSSLQFSSVMEEEDGEPTALMALALGQAPSEFVIVDQALRLVTDSRSGFESDINHPSRLIHEFPILRQDADSITFRVASASPILDTLLFGDNNKVAKRASWVRSLDFASADELFLIQSSVELVDGSIAEFMETITPRERIVPEGVKPIFDDADLNEDAARFRFLDAGKVFVQNPLGEGRVQTKMATRFVQRGADPIKWYVTRNIPAQYVVDVKNAIEAWNRYSRAAGKPDLLRFEGLLPEDVAVGDPRYNVVVWDNIQDAGAAYESQASDPLTGVQSHSLIYLPYAWINIGKEYWENASGTEDKGNARLASVSRFLKSRSFLGRKLPVNCLDGAHMHVTADAQESPEEFARSLLKGVLFHEVGHAMGLAHNFKGSLSFDPDQEKPTFSTSIMDYNQYNEESGAFFGVEGSDGPLMEYDRQIISVLYNEGKDVKETDAVMPACSDDEADSFAGGVDALCVRYDIGTDVTKQALRSLELLSKRDASNGRMTSLPNAVTSALRRLPEAGSVTKLEDAQASINQLTKTIRGAVTVYVGGSANSLGYLGSQAMKSLYVFREDSLPEGYEEDSMRLRSFGLLKTMLEVDSLPAATTEAFAELKSGVTSWLTATPAYTGLPEEERKAVLDGIEKSVASTMVTLEQSLLSRVRTRFVGALKYNPEAPLAIMRASEVTEALDMETEVIRLLEGASSPRLGRLTRPLSERTAAVSSLTSFRSVPAGMEAMGRVREALNVEIRSTTDARQREALRKLASSLK